MNLQIGTIEHFLAKKNATKRLITGMRRFLLERRICIGAFTRKKFCTFTNWRNAFSHKTFIYNTKSMGNFPQKFYKRADGRIQNLCGASQGTVLESPIFGKSITLGKPISEPSSRFYRDRKSVV